MNIIIIFFSVLLYCAMCPSEMTTKAVPYEKVQWYNHGIPWYTMVNSGIPWYKRNSIYAGDVRTTIDQGIVRLIQYLV